MIFLPWIDSRSRMLIFCQHMHSDSTISCEIRSRTAKVLMDFLYSVSGKNDRAQFRSVIFLLFVTNSTVVLVVRNRQIVHILLFLFLMNVCLRTLKLKSVILSLSSVSSPLLELCLQVVCKTQFKFVPTSTTLFEIMHFSTFL